MDRNVNMRQAREHEAFAKIRDAIYEGVPDYTDILRDIVRRLDLIEEALAPQVERAKRMQLIRKAQAIAAAHPEGHTHLNGKNISVTVYDTIKSQE